MKRFIPHALSILSLAVLAGCNNDNAQVKDTNAQVEQQAIKAPIAKKVPHEMKIHGHKRVDNYYWMRDDERKNPEILTHLEAENAYTQSQLSHTENLQNTLFEELKSRIQKDDNSVPTKSGNYYYSSEMRGDNEYPIYVRSSDFKGTDKQTLLDVNELAKGHEYYSASGLAASPNDQLLAYGEDTVSRRIYTIQVKDLKTGKLLEDKIEGAQASVVWANDNQHFYYVKKDPQTLLGYQV